jgi:L-lysine 2,3-aminomutase
MSSPTINIVNIGAAEKWQQILADLLTDPKELLQFLQLDAEGQIPDQRILEAFPLKVPRPFLQRMEKGNWNDPLLRQVLPLDLETGSLPTGEGRNADPLKETQFNPHPGLLHKYPGRVLLTVAPHCAVHCRYCFRRQFDYRGNTPGRAQWQAALDYIASDNSIQEVIFSGGDPLAAGDRYLEWLTGQIAAFPHVQRLRIHSRTPIVIPQRVTPAMLGWLKATRLQPVLVLHCNHAREIDDEVVRAIGSLSAIGISLLNQSVLLKGVNDSSQALKELSEKLFSMNVLPYYLHQLDLVPGVGHFEVSDEKAVSLIAELRALLPGYLVPRLVREIAGETSKLPLG